METGALSLTAALAALPPEWPEDPLPAIQAARRSHPQALVVLDDDPTGTQSVHGLPVLTEWTPEVLYHELAQPTPDDAFYLLTNSRSLPAVQAAALNQEIGRNLAAAAGRAGRAAAVISRSDSTLRGHFPTEVEALAEGLGGRFDAWLLIPAFLAGGRYTLNDIHYVAEGDRLRPAAQTEFARDHSFGYANSDLRRWVEEKSGGRIAAGSVASISLEDLRRGGPDQAALRLLELRGGAVCVVNAASERDLGVLALAALNAEAAGQRLLYRTAASFVRWRAGLAERPLLSAGELNLPPAGGGLIVAGSYVPRTTAQIDLLRATGLRCVEVRVAALLSAQTCQAEVERSTHEVDAALQAGADVLMFTSRELVTGGDAAASLEIGRRVSAALVAIVQAIRTRPRYLLAKGGITASDLATQALGVRRAMVLGQILPGVPVWRLGSESRWPGLALIVFPGNVGGPTALAEVVQRLPMASSSAGASTR